MADLALVVLSQFQLKFYLVLNVQFLQKNKKNNAKYVLGQKNQFFSELSDRVLDII